MKQTVAIVLAIFWLTILWVLTSGSSGSSSSSPEAPPAPTLKTFSAQEVATHSDSSSCWLIINHNVYDVTDFLGLHPGGVEEVLPYCGKEASRAFDTQGGRGRPHSSTAETLLADYYIGILQ